MIFRASQGPYMLTARDADTGSGIALPMPTEERKELESTTPAAAPPREALKQEAAEKDANADRRANAAEPADAPAPTAGAAAPPAAARLAPGAMQRAAIAPTTVAEAEARLGTRVRTIDGLTPLSVEVLPPTADSVTTVEQRYLVSGVTVVLMQRMSPAVSRDEVSAKAREPAPYVDGVGVQPGKRANGFVAAADSGELQPAIRTWVAWGSLFQLRGALPADSIDALMKRVK
jgi:hypothetical protein